ncbi:MAG: succinate dehydrogenase, cytochrome b556 subunit [Gammaproteobacteria bacterium]
MKDDNAPLSPALQIYRPQLTSVLSFMHRLTGIALSLGSLLLIAWLVAGSMGSPAYDMLLGFLRSGTGVLLLFGWTFTLFYHLCNGIRHLCWDAGYGFELKTIYASGWAVVSASLGLTVATWLIGLYALAGGA